MSPEGDYDKYFYKYGTKNESPGVTPILKDHTALKPTAELPSKLKLTLAIVRRKENQTPTSANYPVGLRALEDS